MVEEDVEQDAGEASALGGEAQPGLGDQWVAVGEGVDAPVQADAGFDFRRPAPGQRPLDEVAIEAAEQLRGLRAAEVEVGEVVHRLSLTQAQTGSIMGVDDDYRHKRSHIVFHRYKVRSIPIYETRP
ncbi:hypothetical protein D9M71_569280 [compost metagenome]